MNHLFIKSQNSRWKIECKSFLKSHFIPNVKSQVTAVNKYDPPMEVVAARDHITQLVYQLMQPQVVYDRWVS